MPPPLLPDLVIRPWQNHPMMAFVPSTWKAPKRVTPKWLAEQPLIFNDATTHMYRLTMAWFAAAGCAPRGRIELNYDAAIHRLVVAGYGAALLPWMSSAEVTLTERLQVLPLSPKLTRRLGIAHRAKASLDGATESVIKTLMQFRQT